MSNKYLEKIAKISIKPSHEGMLHKDLGVKKNKKISDSKLESAEAHAKATGNKKLLKRVVFAENAKKWNHKK